MSPKLLTLHLFRHKSRNEFTLESEGADDTVIMLNPRRVDYFRAEPPPTQQPTLWCGTRVFLGSKQSILVRETLAEIKKKLK
jgi:hypothetical protein